MVNLLVKITVTRVYFYPQNTRCHKTVRKEIEHAIIKTLPKSNKKIKKMFAAGLYLRRSTYMFYN